MNEGKRSVAETEQAASAENVMTKTVSSCHFILLLFNLFHCWAISSISQILFFQTQESIAESVMNLSGSEAVVMVTVDPAVEEQQQQPPVLSAAALANTHNNLLTTASNEAVSSIPSTEASVIVHNADSLPLLQLSALQTSGLVADSSDATPTAPEPALDLLSGLLAGHSPSEELPPIPSESGSPRAEGAEGGFPPPMTTNISSTTTPSNVTQSSTMVLGPRPGQKLRLEPQQQHLQLQQQLAQQQQQQQQRATPTNSMSVSVPNLTSSMEQTVGSLLESFGAVHVARRNLGNSTNNMARSSNAISLVRQALSSNSPGE